MEKSYPFDNIKAVKYFLPVIWFQISDRLLELLLSISQWLLRRIISCASTLLRRVRRKICWLVLVSDMYTLSNACHELTPCDWACPMDLGLSHATLRCWQRCIRGFIDRWLLSPSGHLLMGSVRICISLILIIDLDSVHELMLWNYCGLNWPHSTINRLWVLRSSLHASQRPMLLDIRVGVLPTSISCGILWVILLLIAEILTCAIKIWVVIHVGRNLAVSKWVERMLRVRVKFLMCISFGLQTRIFPCIIVIKFLWW